MSKIHCNSDLISAVKSCLLLASGVLELFCFLSFALFRLVLFVEVLSHNTEITRPSCVYLLLLFICLFLFAKILFDFHKFQTFRSRRIQGALRSVSHQANGGEYTKCSASFIWYISLVKAHGDF